MAFPTLIKLYFAQVGLITGCIGVCFKCKKLIAADQERDVVERHGKLARMHHNVIAPHDTMVMRRNAIGNKDNCGFDISDQLLDNIKVCDSPLKTAKAKVNVLSCATIRAPLHVPGSTSVSRHRVRMTGVALCSRPTQ